MEVEDNKIRKETVHLKTILSFRKKISLILTADAEMYYIICTVRFEKNERLALKGVHCRICLISSKNNNYKKYLRVDKTR